MEQEIVSKSEPEIALSYTRAILGIPGVLGVFSVLDVADCVLGTARDVTIAKKNGEQTRGVVPISVIFLEALAQRFVGLGESDKSPRPIQAGRIGGPGRG